MSLPAEFLDELRSRVSLAALVGRRVKLTRRGREHTGLCPFHNEKTPSFTLNEDKGFYHCFGCGAHGDAISFVMGTEGLAFRDAVERLAAEAGLALPEEAPGDRERRQRETSLQTIVEAAAAFYEKQLRMPGGRAAMEYLKRRGLDEATIQRFRLGYAPANPGQLKTELKRQGVEETQMVAAGLLKQPEDGREPFDYFRDRVMFAITDRRGRVVAFGGRILSDGQPKYLNSPDSPLFHKGRMLYGYAHAREAALKTGEVLVVEGYMDVIALFQAGIVEAVAPLGTALTEDQLAELWRLAPEPVLCFDGDAAGERAAARAADRALSLLAPGKSLRFLSLPKGEDPDTLVRKAGPEAVRQLIGGARPLVETLWQQYWAEAQPVNTPERRAKFQHTIRALLARIEDPEIRNLYRRDFIGRARAAFGEETGPHSASAFVTDRNVVRRIVELAYGDGRTDQRSARRWRRFGNKNITAYVDQALREGQGARNDLTVYQTRQEQVLIFTLINHPELLAELGELLGIVALKDPGLEKIRLKLLDIHSFPDLQSTDAIMAELSAEGLAEEIKLLSEKSFLRNFKFVARDAATELAAAGWNDVFQRLQVPILQEELAELTEMIVNPASSNTEEEQKILRAQQLAEAQQLIVSGKVLH
ncbi:MAG: DNA primase [Proteobacteria bacterium]|nr:DNA primase [Pseudomonadota bacterium]MBI3497400.1 DNA primase [Pseudomonadota bacterium]